MSNSLPLVSICIPAYNAEKFIASTIRSALNQTWFNKEIIIVDDGSKDDTLKIARTFESDIVKVVAQKNKGASAARNHALSIAQGDFIQWLDADDILASDKIERQLINSDQNPDSLVLLSSAWGEFYYRLKRAKFRSTPLWQDLSPTEWLIYNIGNTSSRYFMANCSWLVSRKLTELAGPWDERLTYNDDGEYVCRVVAQSKKIIFNKDAVSYYRRVNPFSLSGSVSASQSGLKSMILSVNKCVDYLLALEDSDITRKACINTLNTIISYEEESNSYNFKDSKKRILALGGEEIRKDKSIVLSITIKFIGYKKAKNVKFKYSKLKKTFYRLFEKIGSFIFNDEI